MNLLFQCEKMPRLKVAAELCEDLWTPNPPSVAHAPALQVRRWSSTFPPVMKWLEKTVTGEAS